MADLFRMERQGRHQSRIHRLPLAMNTKLPPIHPGEVLLEDFMKPRKLTPYRVAKDIGVTPIAITQITKGRRSVTAQTALLLAKYFGTTSVPECSCDTPWRSRSFGAQTRNDFALELAA
jgi:addiction module HigA family antidote